MVQVTSRPIKEFVVYRYIKFRSPGELARKAVIEGSPIQPAHLKWLSGIVYRMVYPAASVMSETFAKEFTDGRVWIEVEYAEMPQYRSTVNTIMENVIVPLVDNSGDRDESALIEWLKKLPSTSA